MKYIPPPTPPVLPVDHPESDRTHMEDSEASEDYGSIQPSILFDPGCGLGLGVERSDVGVADADDTVGAILTEMTCVEKEEENYEKEEGREEVGGEVVTKEEDEEDNELNVSSASSHAFSTDQQSRLSQQASMIADDHHPLSQQSSSISPGKQPQSQPQAQAQALEQGMTASMVHIDTQEEEEEEEGVDPINSTEEADDTRLTAQGSQLTLTLPSP